MYSFASGIITQEFCGNRPGTLNKYYTLMSLYVHIYQIYLFRLRIAKLKIKIQEETQLLSQN